MISLNTTPYYSISARLLCQSVQSEGNVLQNIRLNIILDLPANEMHRLMEVAGQLTQSFLFTLRPEELAGADAIRPLLPHCYLLACCAAYANPGKMLIPLFDLSKPAPSVLDLLGSYCIEQDMEEPAIIQFAEKKIAPDSNNELSEITLYSPAFKNEGATEWKQLSIISFPGGFTDIDSYSLALKKAERAITVCEAATGMVPINDHLREVNNWRKRSMLYRDFLGISKSVQEKEYYEVIDWYRREYEQLPLWYKRFGHIIKVVMGKRSFRSLYDDKVKKYKD